MAIQQGCKDENCNILFLQRFTAGFFFFFFFFIFLKFEIYFGYTIYLFDQTIEAVRDWCMDGSLVYGML
jgi:hypothetical protein